jgi:hypothetical protein
MAPFKRLKLASVRPGDLVPLASAEQVMQLPICDPRPELIANRDLPYIRWRYFSRRDATAAAFAFRNKDLESDILVTVNQRPRGYRGQIRTLNLLDIYPPVLPRHARRSSPRWRTAIAVLSMPSCCAAWMRRGKTCSVVSASRAASSMRPTAGSWTSRVFCQPGTGTSFPLMATSLFE